LIGDVIIKPFLPFYFFLYNFLPFFFVKSIAQTTTTTNLSSPSKHTQQQQ
jgi:hypothetical protein